MKIPNIEPNGATKCPSHLIPALAVFIVNDAYKASISKSKKVIAYTKPCKPTLTIDHRGEMNEAMQKRYVLFLKIWLKFGKDFIQRLKAQAQMMMVA